MKAERCRHCGMAIEFWSDEVESFWVHSETLLRQCVLPSRAEPAGIETRSPSDYGGDL